MKFILLAAAIFSLTSCVWPGIEKGMTALQGKPIGEAVNVLGFPSDKMQMGETSVYTWGYNQGGIGFVPQTATTTSFIGAYPVTSTTFYNQAVPMNYSGHLKIQTDKHDKIINWSGAGQNGAMIHPSVLLGKYARSQNKQ